MAQFATLDSLGLFPRNFLTKDRQSVRLQLLGETHHQQFVDAYLAFQPRNSFQGLPPLKDEVCTKWVREMIGTGVNLVAVSQSGIVGHTALFPIDDRKCELLVVVWPKFQNVGIGTELTRGCVDLASALGFEQIWLPVDATNLRARHIYAKCGFEYRSPRHSRELDMVCELNGRKRKSEDAGITIESLGVSAIEYDMDLAATLMREPLLASCSPD
jgi:RimJ/RimL family protein N-acetyltransferase